MPDENQTLNKMTCPYCSQIFGFSGDYHCTHCSKEFALCYQVLSFIYDNNLTFPHRPWFQLMKIQILNAMHVMQLSARQRKSLMKNAQFAQQEFYV